MWENGELALANPDVDITCQLEWSGERDLLDVFVFPAASCSFIHRDTEKVGSIACVCCYAGPAIHVRLVLLGDKIVHVGTCELQIDESGEPAESRIMGITCSASGVLSFMSTCCRFVCLSSPILIVVTLPQLHGAFGMRISFPVGIPRRWIRYRLRSLFGCIVLLPSEKK